MGFHIADYPKHCPLCRAPHWRGPSDEVHWWEVKRAELDHKLPIGLAARQGPREFAISLLPDNLWWICQECHVLKTAKDRRDMRELDIAAGRLTLRAPDDSIGVERKAANKLQLRLFPEQHDADT